jgi:hypothetical protein
MKRKFKSGHARLKTKLGLPDLEHAKIAVIVSLRSFESQRSYRHSIDEFVAWYCSAPRLSFNKAVVLRYRLHLEDRHLAAGTSAHATATTITFETLPTANMFFGGDMNIGTFFPGVNFGPDVTGLNAATGDFNPVAFPPHSGSIVVWSASSNTVNIEFTQTLSSVGFFYTSLDPLTLTGLGAGNLVLGDIVGAANTDGFSGTSDPLFLNLNGITAITIAGSAQNFVLDDLTYTPAVPSTPEPATFLLFASGLAALALSRIPHVHKLPRSASK